MPLNEASLPIGEHIQQSLAECHPLFMRFSAPLFAVDATETPDLFATCTAIEVDRRIYLVTAAHAIFEIEKTGSAVYIGGRSIEVVPTRFARTSAHGDDPVDIAAAEVGPEFVENNGMSFVKHSQLGRGQPQPHLHCMHGYPLTKNKPFKSVDIERKVIMTYAFTYAGALARRPADRDAARTENSYIALSYQRGKNDQGAKVQPPKPKGMSGGGLWIVPSLFSPAVIFLGGILIEHHGNEVLATRIEGAIEFITTIA